MAMRKQQEKTVQDKKFFWFLAALVVVFFLLWIFIAPGRGLHHYLKLDKEMKALIEKNSQLEAKNIELSKDIARLRSDDKYLEKVAREKHGLLKKNETVFDFESRKKKKE